MPPLVPNIEKFLKVKEPYFLCLKQYFPFKITAMFKGVVCCLIFDFFEQPKNWPVEAQTKAYFPASYCHRFAKFN